MQKRTIHALLIGINAYSESPLHGCINDALDVKSFLDNLQADNSEQLNPIHYHLLLAPHEEDMDTLAAAQISEGDYKLPTRNNIIKGFQEHFQGVNDDDICLLYYSGHGSIASAPRPFWHLKSGRQLETLVCLDSRTSPAGRDLLDKELAYLLWDARRHTAAHFLTIMDCCHAGDNTRFYNDAIVVREDRPNYYKSPMKEWLGFDSHSTFDEDNPNDFYYYKNGDENRLMIREAAHTNLGASQETQSAKEMRIGTQRRGVFTYSLMNTLRNGGLSLSYGELLDRLRVQIADRVQDQAPVLHGDKDELFMGQPQAAQWTSSIDFPVLRSHHDGEWVWKWMAGSIHGIQPSTDKVPTIVQIKEWKDNQLTSTHRAAVKEVHDTYSILADDSFSEAEKQLILKGALWSMPKAKIRISWAEMTYILEGYNEEKYAENKKNYAEKKAALTKLYNANAKDYDGLTFVENGSADYEVHIVNGHYALTRPGELAPVFKEQKDAKDFLNALDRIAKWHEVLERGENTDSLLRRDDIEVTVYVFEGKKLSRSMDKNDATRVLQNPTEIQLAYLPEELPNGATKLRQPGLMVELRSPRQELYVYTYWMGSEFGIERLYQPSPSLKAGAGSEFLMYQYRSDGMVQNIETIPISKSPKYESLGVTDFTDYFKFFISLKETDLRYEQKPLPIADSKVPGKDRWVFEDEDPLSAWMAFHIPIRIHKPLEEKSTERVTIDANNNRLATGVSLDVPKGFSCKVSLISEQRIQQEASILRSLGGDSTQLDVSLLPPPSIWAGVSSSSNIISTRSTSNAQANLSVLELEVKEEDRQKMNNNADNFITLQTPIQLQDRESIVPYAYDEETGLYMPMGYTNASGAVVIEQLPAPTAGQIVTEKAIGTRSIGRSIKLFLKRIIWSPAELNQLKQVQIVGEEIKAQPIADDTLADANIQNVLLLIHGIIGNTESLKKATFQHTNWYEKYDVVLTFDYENLVTEIEETAQTLHDKLVAAGILKIPHVRLDIVAHSMGGLVCRSLIQGKTAGHKYVRSLIQVGTPNGGTELSDVRKTMTSLLAWGMNSITAFKPYMAVLTYIGRFVEKKAFKTLNQMAPESPFLTELNKAVIPQEVNHYIVAGNTQLIKSGYKDDDPFWKNFIKAIKKTGTYKAFDQFIFDKPNDMAVTLESAGSIPTKKEDTVAEVACDHISYFEHEKSLAIIGQHLSEASTQAVIAPPHHPVEEAETPVVETPTETPPATEPAETPIHHSPNSPIAMDYTDLKDLLTRNMKKALHVINASLKGKNNDLHNDYILQMASYNNLEKETRKGLITRSTIKVRQAQLTNAILYLIEEMEREGIALVGGDESQSDHNSSDSTEPNKRTILFLAANPDDTTRLRVTTEHREIEIGLKQSDYRDDFILEEVFAVRSMDLMQAMMDKKPHIVHFSGHGEKKGIILEQDNGMSFPISIEALSALFSTQKGVECVVLNSCYSEAQAKEINKHVKYVIGMSDKVPDKTAIDFAIMFYRSLGAGESYQEAFDRGRVYVLLQGLSGADIPVLLVNKNL